MPAVTLTSLIKNAIVIGKQGEMVSNGDNWVRIFDIPEISKHKKGFTIYKVISMLYPESCPEAVTKITVWKRFNEFKKLHREIKVLHNKLHIKDKYPSLSGSTFFKRFDEETLQVRKQSIQSFLEYVGYHAQLFTSNEFVKFFESSHSPNEQLSSNINLIRADLHLPEDPEILVANSDDDHTLSDTDSITTNSDIFNDSIPPNLKRLSKSRLSLSTSMTRSDTASISTTTDSITLLDGQIYPTPPNTPQTADSVPQYIIDASIHVNIAMELERDKKYDDAFTAYKTAIDILLKYGKDDKDYDRRQMVRYKTDKYLIRAEKIYNMYLSSEMQSLRQMDGFETYGQEKKVTQRQMSDLFKYKVIKILGIGMLVLHAERQQLFYIKVIHKTMQFLNDNLILPENVPYMVKLHNYHNCENALFLVLEYCSGKKIWDYIKDPNFPAQDLKKYQENDSDQESEQSFSDLIAAYRHNQNQDNSSDDSFEKVDFDSETSKSERRVSEEEVEVEGVGVACEGVVVKWAGQLVLALEKLHGLGVICYDLRTENLLIDEEGDLVLTYMCNVSEIFEVFGNGKVLHAPPEIYTFEPITSAVDWWGFGTILYELLVGMSLSTMHPDGLTNYANLKIPKFVSPEGRSLIRQLLVSDPGKRLGYGANGVESLKSHPFFRMISWEKLLAKYNH